MKKNVHDMILVQGGINQSRWALYYQNVLIMSDVGRVSRIHNLIRHLTDKSPAIYHMPDTTYSFPHYYSDIDPDILCSMQYSRFGMTTLDGDPIWFDDFKDALAQFENSTGVIRCFGMLPAFFEIEKINGQWMVQILGQKDSHILFTHLGLRELLGTPEEMGTTGIINEFQQIVKRLNSQNNEDDFITVFKIDSEDHRAHVYVDSLEDIQSTLEMFYGEDGEWKDSEDMSCTITTVRMHRFQFKNLEPFEL